MVHNVIIDVIHDENLLHTVCLIVKLHSLGDPSLANVSIIFGSFYVNCDFLVNVKNPALLKEIVVVVGSVALKVDS